MLNTFVKFLLLVSKYESQRSKIRARSASLRGRGLAVVRMSTRSPKFEGFVRGTRGRLGLRVRAVTYPTSTSIQRTGVSAVLRTKSSSVSVFSIGSRVVDRFGCGSCLGPLGSAIVAGRLLSDCPRDCVRGMPVGSNGICSIPCLVSVVMF